MKKLFMMLFVASNGIVMAQNQLSTPVGQTLKVATDTLVVNSLVNIKGGSLYLNGQRFLTTYTNPQYNNARNTYAGASGNLSNSASNNSFFGAESGINISSGNANTFYGTRSGKVTSTGTVNTFIGFSSGLSNTIGSFNTFLGASSGHQITTGGYNVFLGNESGSLVTTGSSNVYIGHSASYYNVTGSNNVAIGVAAGPIFNQSSGSGNVYIGSGAGNTDTGSNHLYIANTNTTTPIILGDFSTGKLGFSTKNFPASVTTATTPPVVVNTSNYRLFVKGGILTEALTVAGGWADYVFEKGYRLKPLSEVETFIEKNGHLPNVPSARNIELGGINVGDIARIQQEKIEELTLYVIELEKNNKVQALTNSTNERRLTEQQKELKDLRLMMTELIKRSK
jgi:hypothetical protein